MLARIVPILAVVAIAMTALAPAAPAQTTASQPSTVETLEQLMTLPAPPERRGLCVPTDRAEADQFMRLHTELLVASLACDQSFGVGDGDLYQDYRRFNQRHARLIIDSQQDLETAFSVGGDGVAAFNTYRTRMANEEADRLRRLTAPTYCRVLSRRFDYLIEAEPDALAAYIADSAGRARYRSGC